jgi:hypothetical protein
MRRLIYQITGSLAVSAAGMVSAYANCLPYDNTPAVVSVDGVTRLNSFVEGFPWCRGGREVAECLNGRWQRPEGLDQCTGQPDTDGGSNSGSPNFTTNSPPGNANITGVGSPSPMTNGRSAPISGACKITRTC